jgi:hypothetical protein
MSSQIDKCHHLRKKNFFSNGNKKNIYFCRFLTNISPLKCLISMSIRSIYNLTLSIKSQNILSIKTNSIFLNYNNINIHFPQMMFSQFPFHVYVEIIFAVQHPDHHRVYYELILQVMSIYQHQHYRLLQLLK